MKCDVGLMIDRDVQLEKSMKQGRDVKLLSYTHWSLITSFNALPSGHVNALPSGHAQRPHLLPTPTSHNFQPYISFLKIVASGCDQCVWAVGVVTGHGHWLGH